MFFFFYCLLIFGSSRCCVSERIPISYLEQVRDKYLNYDTRAQRKDFLLNCKDPRSRLARALFGIQWSACYYCFVYFMIYHCQRVTFGNFVHIASQTCTFPITQEWVFSRKWCFPHLLERSQLFARLFNWPAQLMRARSSCQNTAQHCASRGSWDQHVPHAASYRSSTSKQGGHSGKVSPNIHE